MRKNKIVTITAITTLSVLILDGCASNVGCSKYSQKNGYFCYQNYNFGKHKSHIYKRGVRDGCHTANGSFAKNYSLSRRSKEYVLGWDAGRTKCRQIVPESATADGIRTQYQQAIDEHNGE